MRVLNSFVILFVSLFAKKRAKLNFLMVLLLGARILGVRSILVLIKKLIYFVFKKFYLIMFCYQEFYC